MITRYLALSFWPRDLVVFYGWPQPLTIADVLPHLSLVAALLVATAVTLVRAPAVGFLGAWFFITLAPTSSIVPIATEVGAERRMYLPLAAVIVLVLAGAWTMWHRAVKGADRGAALEERPVKRRPVKTRHAAIPAPARATFDGRPVAALIVAVVAIALSVTTMARNREYASAVRLAETVVERRPTGVAHHILAEQLVLTRRADEAAVHLRQALALGNSRAGYLLGVILLEQRKLDEAVSTLEAFVATSELPYRPVPRWLEPPVVEVVQARVMLGQAAAARGAWDIAAAEAERVLQSFPSHAEALRLLADARFEQRQWEQARSVYVRYLQRRPGDALALMNLGVTFVATSRLDEAVAAFEQAASADPSNARARQLLDMARRDRAGIP
jgi:tetratricopeptide (TPR) repeat protein